MHAVLHLEVDSFDSYDVHRASSVATDRRPPRKSTFAPHTIQSTHQTYPECNPLIILNHRIPHEGLTYRQARAAYHARVSEWRVHAAHWQKGKYSPTPTHASPSPSSLCVHATRRAADTALTTVPASQHVRMYA